MMNFMLAAQMTETELKKVVQPILDVCKTLIPVLLAVVGAVGAIFCIVLGVKYSKADDPQEHEKAKNGLKNAIIGFVLIFVLLVMLELGVNFFTGWWADYDVA